jgi:NADH dehydrogenase (ubiquinone) 1 alpha subcomplex subunit 9
VVRDSTTHPDTPTDPFFFPFVVIAADGWQFWVNESQTKILPVSAVDVAKAIEVIFGAESTLGKTYELYG